MAFSSDNDKLMVTAYSILSDEIKNNISEMSKSKKEQICYKICRNANFTEKKILQHWAVPGKILKRIS